MIFSLILRLRLAAGGVVTKTLIIMNVIAMLLLVFCLQVSASGLSQTITYSGKDVNLPEIFTAVRQQTGYLVIANKNQIDKIGKVSVEAKNLPLADFMKMVLESKGFEFFIEGKNISVRERKGKGAAVRDRTDDILNIPPFLIKLRVTDADGNTLSGASIANKNTKSSGSTDASGMLSMNASEGDILTISFVGFESMQIKLTSATTAIAVSSDRQFDNTTDIINYIDGTLNISLKPSESKLDEFVVKGYYSTKKTLNTGSVGTIKASEIEKQPVSDPLMALEGRISGLYISQNSGLPGASLTVRLRGQNSIANGNDPFYIIDGVPFPSTTLTQIGGAASSISPFSTLRPNEIESIEVLKDADATSIYGSRGANGVILITTKKGKSGKTKVDFNIYNGSGKVTRKLKLMNTEQYLEMRREAFKNDNKQFGATDYDVNGTWDQNRYTDWQDLIFGRTANITDGQATISGGNQQTQFLLSLGYRRETTVLPGDYLDRKGSGRLSISHVSENKKFRALAQVNYVNDNNRLPSDIITSGIYLAPNAPALYKENGELNWENSTWSNPFARLNKSATTITDNMISNLSLEYSIIEDLILKTNLGYSLITGKEKLLTPFTASDPALLATAQTRRSHSFSNNTLKTWIIEPQLSYTKRIGKHQLEGLVATTIQENSQNKIRQTASGFSSDGLIENIAAATSISGSTDITQYRYNALFARIGYNYAEKYVLNLTGRRDGSSRFGPGRQFGNFGAVGVAWIFSKEKFMEGIRGVINYGKLRGSIGSTGNDQLTDYQYLDTYSPNSLGYLGVNGLNPTQLTNSEFGWEKLNKIEAGIEVGLLANRIQINTSYYRNRTGNQLVGYPLPSYTGFTTVQANLPAIIENRGIELDINTINVQTSAFNWNTSFNISFPRSRLVSYPNIAASSYATTYAVGQPLSVKYLYRYSGIDPTTGLYTFEDLNKDGAITSAADRVPVFVGQRFFGGLNNSFTYNNFSLDIFVQFVSQSGYNFVTNGTAGAFSNSSLFGNNQPVSALNRWRSPGDVAKIQRYTQVNFGVPAETYLASDARIENASFVRLKNVMISYSLPKTMLSKIGLKAVRFYGQGQNLLTVTKYKGLDPENTFTGAYPPMPTLRILTFGLQISL